MMKDGPADSSTQADRPARSGSRQPLFKIPPRRGSAGAGLRIPGAGVAGQIFCLASSLSLLSHLASARMPISLTAQPFDQGWRLAGWFRQPADKRYIAVPTNGSRPSASYARYRKSWRVDGGVFCGDRDR